MTGQRITKFYAVAKEEILEVWECGPGDIEDKLSQHGCAIAGSSDSYEGAVRILERAYPGSPALAKLRISS